MSVSLTLERCASQTRHGCLGAQKHDFVVGKVDLKILLLSKLIVITVINFCSSVWASAGIPTRVGPAFDVVYGHLPILSFSVDVIVEHLPDDGVSIFDFKPVFTSVCIDLSRISCRYANLGSAFGFSLDMMNQYLSGE
jgi:hypothetical protein